MKYTLPKGVFDLLPHPVLEENPWRTSDRWFYVEEVLRQCAHDYGYREMRTPIFEKTELFLRSVGEDSDIVSKEMYTFLDKGNRSITLRPEGTVPIMRAFVENHLDRAPGPYKYFYIAPMFRHERPQSGRYRQHHQFGVEAIGIANAYQDVEMIDMSCELLRRLGLREHRLFLNSVGDALTRVAYRQALTEYLHPHFEHLSKESQFRFQRNVLRILDSKDAEDQDLLLQAPSILDFLSEKSLSHFEEVKSLLAKESIPFIVNTRLVRGLDYYYQTVFEITSGGLGAQNSLGGGGRFDGLIAALGGPNLPSVGFAIGLERLLQAMHYEKINPPLPLYPLLFLIPVGEKALSFCFSLTLLLRHRQLPIEIDLSGGKIQRSLRQANRENARFAVVIGERELESRKIEVKEMKTHLTQSISLEDLEEFVKNCRTSFP